MHPAACHKCPDNPQGTETKRLNLDALEKHRLDIAHIERMHDLTRMNLLTLSDIADSETDLLRAYYWEVEKIRMKSGVKL